MAKILLAGGNISNVPTIWRSINSGTTWGTVPIDVPGSGTISEISIGFGDVALAVSALGRVYRSVDKGATWIYISSVGITGNAQNTKKPVRIFWVGGTTWLCGGSSLRRSTDDGASWGTVTGASSNINCIGFAPNGIDIFANFGAYPALINKNTILSTNGGATWTQVDMPWPGYPPVQLFGWFYDFCTYGSTIYAVGNFTSSAFPGGSIIGKGDNSSFSGPTNDEGTFSRAYWTIVRATTQFIVFHDSVTRKYDGANPSTSAVFAGVTYDADYCADNTTVFTANTSLIKKSTDEATSWSTAYTPEVGSSIIAILSTSWDGITPPVADFTGTPTSGPASLSVAFTDTSTGTPTSWDWDFGDGSTHDTTQNPTHVYTVAGTYTVTLTATKGATSDTEIKTNYIAVGLLVDFSATPVIGRAPLFVRFSDLTTGNPTAWAWTFGDGGTSSLKNPVYLYNSAGTYTVSLTASNISASGTRTKTSYITATFYSVSTEDVAPPVDRIDLRTMYGEGYGKYSYPKKGVQISIPQGTVTDSGFTRPQGPTLVFD